MHNGNNGTHSPAITKKAKEDRFQGHDYYNLDELLEDDHLLARDAVRSWVKQEVSPIIEEYAEKALAHNICLKVWQKSELLAPACR